MAWNKLLRLSRLFLHLPYTGTKTMNYIDITKPLNKITPYPGDPKLKTTPIKTITPQSPFHLEKITMSNHLGTHIDFPAHVIKNGKSSSDYDLNDLIMPCIVIEVSSTEITAQSLTKLETTNAILFKTKNEDTYITDSAAKKLIEANINLVGINTMSVDAHEESTLPTHNQLLKNEILILENLELNHVRPGNYQLYVLPLKIEKMDGLPVRAMLLAK